MLFFVNFVLGTPFCLLIGKPAPGVLNSIATEPLKLKENLLAAPPIIVKCALSKGLLEVLFIFLQVFFFVEVGSKEQLPAARMK